MAFWGRAVATLLVGTLLVQVAPVQPILHLMTSHDQPHHAAHEVCPRNPDGPCVCDHAHHGPTSSEEGPSLRACGGPADQGVLGGGSMVKGVIAVAKRATVRDRGEKRRILCTADLASQRVADDIFRPPRFHVG